MKLWKISQTERRGYDTFSDAIVAAKTEEEAQRIPPDLDYYTYGEEPTIDEYWKRSTEDMKYYGRVSGPWASSPDNVTAEYIGEAVPGIKAGVILASFHAG